MSNRIWHITELQAYQRCPLAYYYSYQQDEVTPKHIPWARERGSILHKVFEKGAESFDDVWEAHMQQLEGTGIPILAGNATMTAEEHIERDRENCRNITRLFFDKIARDRVQILERECTHRYLIPIPGEKRAHRFEGTVDAVALHPDTPEGMVEFHDYKTGLKWCDEALNRDLQFGAYSELANQNGYNLNRMFWCQTKDLEPYKRDGKYGKKGEPKGQFWYPVRITRPCDMRFIFESVHNIIKAIEAGIKYPAAGGQDSACKRCEWAYECPRFRVGVERENKAHKMFEAEMKEMMSDE